VSSPGGGATGRSRVRSAALSTAAGAGWSEWAARSERGLGGWPALSGLAVNEPGDALDGGTGGSAGRRSAGRRSARPRSSVAARTRPSSRATWPRAGQARPCTRVHLPAPPRIHPATSQGASKPPAAPTPIVIRGRASEQARHHHDKCQSTCKNSRLAVEPVLTHVLGITIGVAERPGVCWHPVVAGWIPRRRGEMDRVHGRSWPALGRCARLLGRVLAATLIAAGLSAAPLSAAR